MALDPDRELNQYNRQVWGVDQQLPQISVTAITQDKQGYFWVGTQNGFARFNTKDFFGHNRSNTPALQSNIIRDLWVDDANTLWILSDLGLAKKVGKKISAISDPEGALAKPYQLSSFGSQLLAASEKGVFSIGKNQITPLKLPGKTPENNNIQPTNLTLPSYSLKAFGDRLIVGHRGRFSIYTSKKLTTIDLPKAFERAIVNDIQVDSDRIWLATSYGALYYEASQFVQPFDKALAHEPATALFLDSSNVLWLATDSACYRFVDGQRIHLSEKPSYPRVSSFYADREGSLWLGTSDRGLFQLWNSWSARYAVDHGIKESLAWSVAVKNTKSLLVGTDNGVYQSRISNDAIEFSSFIDSELLPNPSAYTLYVDVDQSIWVGTKSGLAHFSATGDLIKNNNLNIFDGLQINAIARDSQMRLWVLTTQGAFVKDKHQTPKAGESVKFRLVGAGNEFSKKSYRAIYDTRFIKNKDVDQKTDQKGSVYLATHSGLLRYSKQNGAQMVKEPRLKTFVTSLTNYLDYLVVGTYSEGIFVKTKTGWRQFRKYSGLVFDDSFSLNVFDGDLWVSGFDGVYRIHQADFEQALASDSNSMISDPILKDSGYVSGSQKAYCCNGAGHAKSASFMQSLWFPTRSGVLRLEPSKVIKNQQMVSTAIESVSLAGQSYDFYLFDQKSKQHQDIQFTERDIAFNVVGLTAFDKGLVEYRYRLKGYTNQWRDNQTSRQISFTNLPSGQFVFQVLAKNSNGIWAKEPTQFRFSITPHYYETVYFKIFVFFFSLLLLHGFYRLSVYRNAKRVNQLEALVTEKTTELQESNQKLEEAVKQLEIVSFTDPLTGAGNRRYFVQQIDSDIAHYTRESKSGEQDQNLVFILADLDFFKDINDQFGHNTGDKLLQQVVDCIQSNIRNGDYLIRWGGEEFLIVLRPDHVSRVEEICIRLLNEIAGRDFISTEGDKINMTISLGFCFYPMQKLIVEQWGWEQVIEQADKALYSAKTGGRNQYVGFQLLPQVQEAFDVNELDDKAFQRFSGSPKP